MLAMRAWGVASACIAYNRARPEGLEMGTLPCMNTHELRYCDASRPHTVIVDADADRILRTIGGVCVHGGSQGGDARLYTSSIMHACMNARLLTRMASVDRMLYICVVTSYTWASRTRLCVPTAHARCVCVG